MGRRQDASGVLAAPVLPTINLVIHPLSISPPPVGGVQREEEELKEGGVEGRSANGHRIGDTEHPLGLMGSRAHQPRSPVPLCFAQKQAVGIVVESSALRDGSPLDSNRGLCEEEGRERRGERSKKG